MTMEELARYIAENWGREAVTGRGCWERLELALDSRDMPCADADIQRLEDMITNLLDEVWRERPPLVATEAMMRCAMNAADMPDESNAWAAVQAVIEEINNP